jgi:hypothetical protein
MGMTRSQAANFMSKGMFGKESDSLALGFACNSEDTFAVASEWADRIVLVEPVFPSFVPARHHKKLLVLNIGPDVWGNPGHEELKILLGHLLLAWRQSGFGTGSMFTKKPDHVQIEQLDGLTESGYPVPVEAPASVPSA